MSMASVWKITKRRHQPQAVLTTLTSTVGFLLKGLYIKGEEMRKLITNEGQEDSCQIWARPAKERTGVKTRIRQRSLIKVWSMGRAPIVAQPAKNPM